MVGNWSSPRWRNSSRKCEKVCVFIELAGWFKNALKNWNNFLCFQFQLKPNRTKVNVSPNHCGLFSKFIIRNRDTFTIYSIVVRPSVASYMITVLRKKSLTPTWLRNGRNRATRTCAVCVAFKPVTPISAQIAFAVCRNRSWKKDESLNAYIVVAEVALVRHDDALVRHGKEKIDIARADIRLILNLQDFTFHLNENSLNFIIIKMMKPLKLIRVSILKPTNEKQMPLFCN